MLLNTQTHVFPVLETPQRVGNAYTLPFYFSENPQLERRFPLIVFRQQTDNESLIIHDPEELDMDGGELVTSAIRNLSDQSLNWKLLAGGKILMAEHADYGAEKILDKAFLSKAFQQLNAQRLVVGIPCKGILVCADADKHVNELATQVALHYQDAFRVPLTDVVFFYENGMIQSAEQIRVSLPTNDILNAEESDDLPEGVHVQLINMSVFTGDYYYKIIIGKEADATGLLEGIYKCVLQVLRKYHKDERFLGIIEIQSDPSTIAKQTDLDTEIGNFLHRMKSLGPLQEIARRMKRHIEISFLFGEDFSSGNAHLKKVIRIDPKN